MSYRQIGILRSGLFLLLLLSGRSLVLLLFCCRLSGSGSLLRLGLLSRCSLLLRGLSLTSELGVVRLSLLELGLELASVYKDISAYKIAR